jgi:hypothetical protein
MADTCNAIVEEINEVGYGTITAKNPTLIAEEMGEQYYLHMSIMWGDGYMSREGIMIPVPTPIEGNNRYTLVAGQGGPEKSIGITLQGEEKIHWSVK